MKRFIAFDPATRTGWAYRNAGQIITGNCHGHDVLRLRDVLRDAVAAGCTNAIIESTYLKDNVKTLEYLCVIRGVVSAMCWIAGLETETVAASSWQTILCVSGCKPCGRTAIKAASRRIAKLVGGVEPETEDECDAVCILLYAEARARQTEMTLVTKIGKVC